MAGKQEDVACHSQPLSDGVALKVEGDIDFSRSPSLRSQIMQVLTTDRPRLVVDLAGVPYMDSSGVATLVEALQVQRRKGHKLILCNLQPKVKGIFEISRLDMVFAIAPDMTAAAKL